MPDNITLTIPRDLAEKLVDEDAPYSTHASILMQFYNLLVAALDDR